jgi:uncharacterized membrane protein (DUF485 family)
MYFVLMLLVPLRPDLLGAPISPGSNWTIGMIGGIASFVVLIGGAVIYTKWVNKLETRG